MMTDKAQPVDEASSSPPPVVMWPRVHWGWLVGIVIFGWFVWQTASVMPPFIAGIVIAYLLDPVADKLEARGLPRWLATILPLSVFFAALAGIVVLIVPLLIDQAEELITGLPELVAVLRPLAESLYARANIFIDLEGIGGTVLARVGGIAAGLLQSAVEQSFALFNILALVVIMPIVSFYALRDFDHMTAQIARFVPPQQSARVFRLLAEMDKALSGFIRGQFLVCLSLAVFYAIGWSLTGLNFALVLGLIAGILAFIPYLGAVISVLLALLVGLGQFGFEFWPLFFIFLVFQVGQIIEGSILTPNLIGERIGLHPLWVLFAVFAGGEIAGIWGIFLAVPVAAILAVLVKAAGRAALRTPLFAASSGE
ncbi:MAG: AI-2E family transporter [Pacificimonas sp.]